MKNTDPTIDNIHQIRRAISDRFGGNVFAIAEDAARRQAASNRPVWNPSLSEEDAIPESIAATTPQGQPNRVTG